jgi:cytochrome c553
MIRSEPTGSRVSNWERGGRFDANWRSVGDGGLGHVRGRCVRTGAEPNGLKSGPPSARGVVTPPAGNAAPPSTDGVGNQAPAGDSKTPPRQQTVHTIEEQFATCLACHGREGQSETPEVPSIAGQPSMFVANQLSMFREGKRKIPAMDYFAKQFTDENVRRYAEIISALPRPAPLANKENIAGFERGKMIAAAARCDSCHGTDYSGNGLNPRLANQREDYLAKALRDYASAIRVGDPAAATAHAVSAAEMADLAHYLAHFH